jgi:flagellin-like hook-associated protein FlgL
VTGQINFQNDLDLEKATAALANAQTSLRSIASTFGSHLSTVQTRQDFSNAMISTLKTGADTLVLADTNEEGANLLALNTRQQLSQTALSLASQADQGVLRLFG